MAEEKKQEMLDPIAYREDFPKEYLTDYDPMADLTPEYLENMDYGKEIGGANQSFSQYGDDSSPDYQNKSKGGLNDKYTGEGVKNDQVNYDANLMLKDLNPNFVYGLASKVYGTDHPGYITQRNDQIASALYNEGKTSKDDVAYFLGQQKGWMNSSEADRANTIEAVYKRLGAIAEQNPKEEEKPDLSKADNLVQDTSGKIYGKTTAEEGEPSKGIDTLADANSVFTSMQESRAANLKNLVSMKPETVAELELSGVSPYGEQAMRDAQQLYPEFMAQVEAAKKKKLGQDNVNAIASGGEITTMADKVDTNSQATSYAVNNSSSSVSPTQLLKSIDERLIESDSAQSAKDLMLDIKNSEAQLKNRMRNLKQEANSKFKGDVPDYLVNAYINNKSQEIQNQLSILADRYSSAYDIYKTELAHAEWQSELDLKKDSLALEEWKAKNTSTTTTTSSSQDGRMRTERNNNPTAMTTDYAKMMGLELGVDYEIGDSFIGGDGRTYYTARFLGDPVETAIKAFDRGAANNVFANEGGVLGHWHLGISNQKWLSLTDGEKREVINKILQKEGGKMDNMSYYLNNTDNDEKVTYNPAWEDMLRQIATGQVKLNSATAKSYAEMMGTDVRGLGKMVEAYQADQLENGKAAGRDLLNIMAELQILFEDKGLDDGQFDTNAWQSLGWGAIGRKHDQLKEQLKLNKVTEARDKGATFGQMTEYEWKVLENAATSLNILKQDDKEYTDEFKKIMRATWIAAFGKAPTEQEWQDYVKQQRVYQSFNLSSSGASENDKLSQIGSGSVGTGVNFGDVVQNGK